MSKKLKQKLRNDRYPGYCQAIDITLKFTQSLEEKYPDIVFHNEMLTLTDDITTAITKAKHDR
jgi:hypothetical protein